MWDTIRKIFQNHFVGDDRVVPDEKPPVLRRSTINICAILVIGLVLFGTMMPVHPASHLSADAPTFAFGWYYSGPIDIWLNVLMYVPMGLFLRLILRRRDRAAAWEIPGAVCLAFGFSLATEYLQQFIPFRVPSLTDVTTNVLGALIGAAIAPRFQLSFRNAHAMIFYAVRDRPFRVVARFATVMVLASLWAPFDLHTSPTGFAAELDRAKWTPYPSAFYFTGGTVVESIENPYKEPLNDLGTFGAFFVLGFFVLLGAKESGRSNPAAFRRTLVLLLWVACFAECGQLLFTAHTFDVWDICLALFSGMLGGGVARSLQAQDGIERGERPRIVCPTSAVTLALLFQVAYLLLRGFAPFHFGMKGSEFEAWFWIPFDGEIFRGRLGMLGDSVHETFRYIAAAFLLVLYMDSHLQEVRGWHVCGILLCVVGLSELFQVFLAGRYADTTTPVLVIAASWIVCVAYRAVVIDLRQNSALARHLTRRRYSLVESFQLLRDIEKEAA